MKADYLESIVAHYERQYPWLSQQRGGWPDRRGEYWALCPFHADRESGSFSFSERGYKCFACGAHGGLSRLAETLGLVEGWSAPLRLLPRPAAKTPATPRPEPAWQKDPRVLDRFQPLGPLARQYCHRRGLRDETIARWRLGCGVLPASRAKLPRLILPVFAAGQLVGLRGRALLPEDKEAKWLQSAGSRTTLFGADCLASGRTVIVTEAPLSAILAMQEAPEVVAAVAGTAGAGCWRPEWTEAIARSRPAWALVWYDCDPAGLTNGVKVVNALLEAGVRARLYRWPAGTPPKTDLADVVVEASAGGR